jgi:predicted flap endonuclease-1-like 5' DNA nuclease
MKKPLAELRGTTESMLTKLKAQGLQDSAQFLEAARTPHQRKELAKLCECAERDILELANRADLARLKGIGGAYSDLLEKAGVDTIKELRHRRPDNLHAKMLEVNGDGEVVKQLPTPAQVEDWVAQAKELPPMLEY